MTIENKLQEAGQEHVLAFWDQLSAEEKTSLSAQLDSIDFAAVRRMQAMLQDSGAEPVQAEIEPAPVIELEAFQSKSEEGGWRQVGEAALREGKVGVLLVAGGQGSRLGYDGPKGAYRIGPISNASLFEIHARKIVALEQAYQASIPFYIMTSQANDAATKAFFKENDYFGLDRERVRFFSQGMWPALDAEGKLVLEQPGKLFMSPDGHGGTISALKATGQFDDMTRRGIETLFYFQVDNPLVDLAAPAFIGAHRAADAEISIKVCAKRDGAEKIGVVANRGGRLEIVEYSELTPEQMNECGDDGRLRLLFGSVAIHVFSVDFLKRMAEQDLPIHVAHKKVPYVDAQGQPVTPDAPNAYKFEKFIFDVVPEARKALNIEFDRAEEFSPVKNAEGEDSPATTQRDMTRKFARWLEAAGAIVKRGANGEPFGHIEIDPCFALSPEDLVGMIAPGLVVNGDLWLTQDDGDE